MCRKKKLLKKLKSNQKMRFEELERLIMLYGFEIDKSSGGAHWVTRHKNLVNEEGELEDYSFWRPHGAKEKFLSPKTKKVYLKYIEKAFAEQD